MRIFNVVMASHYDVLSVPLPIVTFFPLKWRLKCRKLMEINSPCDQFFYVFYPVTTAALSCVRHLELSFDVSHMKTATQLPT
jgi:hypothetical protein